MKVSVKLLKNHIHELEERVVGEIIEVEQHVALYLAKHGVIDPAKLPAKLRPADDAAPASPKATGKPTAATGTEATKE